MCRGGAKCVAAAFTGSVSEDPYCYWRVARAASRRVRLGRELRQGAAAALLGLGVSAGLGGCFSPVGEGQPEMPGTTLPAKGAPPDSGMQPLQAADASEPIDAATPTDPPDAALDFCENVDCNVMCDYGCLPPPCCAQQRPDAGTPPDAAMAPDAATADPCEHVCCQCDYGIIPDDCCL